jgi:probable F420-dependent oxidoreductase
VRFWNSLAFLETEHLVPMAELSEALGFHGVTVSDHVVHPQKIDTPYPYTADGLPWWNDETPWPDPWVLIGALATVTQRIRFTTNVYVVPLRNVFMAAKTIATASMLSGGRVALGMGAGWMREEFELMGQAFDRRGKRMDEMVEALRLLWTGETVEYHGEHVDFDRLSVSPAPPAQVPIWVGGHSDVALQRAARLDGWIGNLYEPDEAVAYARKLRDFRRAAGTADRDDYEVALSVSAAPTPDVLAKLEDAGVTSLLTAPWMFAAGSSWDERRAAMEQFAARTL